MTDMNTKGKILNTENMRDDRETISALQKKIIRYEKSKSNSRISSPLRYLYNFGLVGFNIAVALFIMLNIGYWLGQKYPIRYGTFMLYAIILGIALGIYNSYRLIKQEQQKLDKEDIK